MGFPLRQLPYKSFRDTITFYPEVLASSPRGADKQSYPSGFTVKANVQPVTGGRNEPDGVVTNTTSYNIFIRMVDYLKMLDWAGEGVKVDSRLNWTDGARRSITLGSKGETQDQGGRGVIAWIQAVEISIN